jgi:hypothetical protein
MLPGGSLGGKGLSLILLAAIAIWGFSGFFRVLVVHPCLSFPSIMQTRRHLGSTTKGSTVAVRTGERLTAGSCLAAWPEFDPADPGAH